MEFWINSIQQKAAVRLIISFLSGLTQTYSKIIAADLSSEALVEKVLPEYLRN